MAQNRTLQFIGYAYGNTPVSLTAEINGTQVFSGEVPTIDTEIPPPPNDLSGATALFTLTDSPLFPVDFSGTYPMTVSVDNGYGIVIQNVLLNYMYHANVPGNATDFYSCYNGDAGITDPRSDVTIDGVAQTVTRPPNGPWIWTVDTGSTLACNLNVSLGNDS